MASVIINDRVIEVDGSPARQVITPFGAHFGTGTLERSDLSLAKSWAFENFKGGLGVERRNEEGQRDRYSTADGVNTSKGTEVLLSTLLTTGPDIDSVPEHAIVFKGDLYICAADKKIYKRTGDTTTSIQYTAANLITDLIVYNQGGTEFLFAAFGTQYAYSSDGASWSVPSSAEDADYFTIFDNNLIILSDDDQKIKKSVNPANASPTWADVVTNVQGSARGVTNFRDQDGKPSIWYATEHGLSQVDYDNTKAYFIYDYSSTPYANNGTSLVEYNGSLHFPIGQELLAIAPQGSVISIGPDRDDGLIDADHGTYIARIIKLQNFLLVLNRSSTKSAVFLMDSGQWHPLTYGLSQTNMLIHEVVTSSGNPRVWVGNGTDAIQFFRFNDQSTRKSPFTGQTFKASGTWETSWEHFGFPEFPKVIFQCVVRARDLTSTEYVKIEYQADDQDLEADWTELGRTDGRDGRQIMDFDSGKGININNIRLRITLNRNSSDSSKSPKVEAIVLKYLPTPEDRYGWEMTIPISDRDLLDWLIGLKDATRNTNIEFYPDADKNKAPFYVQVTNGPTIVGSQDSKSGHKATTYGVARLTVAVPV